MTRVRALQAGLALVAVLALVGGGYLWLRGIPGPEAVAPLCTLIQDIAEPLGLLWPARDARTAPLVRPGAALTGTGYDDPRWLRSRSACSPILVSPLSATSPV